MPFESATILIKDCLLPLTIWEESLNWVMGRYLVSVSFMAGSLAEYNKNTVGDIASSNNVGECV